MDDKVNTLTNPADAKLLRAIEISTDHQLPCPPIPFGTLGKFALNDWIKNVGDGADDFVITEAGRAALAEFERVSPGDAHTLSARIP